MLRADIRAMPELYSERSGRADGSIVLFSAGLGGQSAYWRPQWAAIGQAHGIIAYDHRGTGRSAALLPAPYAVDDMARDMLQVLDEHGIDRAHIVGHAAGGVAGLAFAALFPDRIRSLSVVNGWLEPNRHFQRCFEIRKTLLFAGGPRAYLSAQPLFLYPANWHCAHFAEIDETMAHHLERFPSNEVMLARIEALERFDFRTRADLVKCPVLVIAADDDALVPSDCSDDLAGVLAHAHMRRLPWGGHAVNVTDPDGVSSMLLQFLNDADRAKPTMQE